VNRIYFLLGIAVLTASAGSASAQGLLGTIVNAAKQAQQRQQAQPQTPATQPVAAETQGTTGSASTTQTIGQDEAQRFGPGLVKADEPSADSADYKACISNLGKDGKDPYAEKAQCAAHYVQVLYCKPKKLSADQVAKIQIVLRVDRGFGGNRDPRTRDVILVNNMPDTYLSKVQMILYDTVNFNRQAQTWEGYPAQYILSKGGKRHSGFTGIYDKVDVLSGEGCVP